jgi:Mlc titration factor MtfA (ptsG expression regulator)
MFLVETDFEGVDGLEVTDEMRLMVAAQACSLLLGLGVDGFANVSTVILFPRSPVRRQVRRLGGGIMDDSVMHLGGEAHPTGPVMLVWPSVRRSTPGRNVVLHEFAHKLDMADGYTDGVPAMVAAADRAAFDKLFESAFVELTEGADFLDRYATTSRVEFFAVATETFFEDPNRLVESRPDLYQALSAVYRQNPMGTD